MSYPTDQIMNLAKIRSVNEIINNSTFMCKSDLNSNKNLTIDLDKNTESKNIIDNNDVINIIDITNVDDVDDMNDESDHDTDIDEPIDMTYADVYTTSLSNDYHDNNDQSQYQKLYKNNKQSKDNNKQKYKSTIDIRITKNYIDKNIEPDCEVESITDITDNAEIIVDSIAHKDNYYHIKIIIITLLNQHMI